MMKAHVVVEVVLAVDVPSTALINLDSICDTARVAAEEVIRNCRMDAPIISSQVHRVKGLEF